MTNLIIENQKARTEGRANLRWYGLKPRMEGRCSLAKDGSVSFVASLHNLEVWKSAFPDATIADKDAETKAFERFIVDQERPPFSFKSTPYPHQMIGFDKLKDKPYFAFLAEQGTGKSAMLSYVLSHKWTKGEIDAAIILSPKGVHFQWVEEQLPTHVGIPYAAWAWQNKKKELERLETEVMTFDGLRVIAANIDAIKTKDGLATLESFIKRHHGRVLMAVDEAHSLKNPAAQRSKIAHALGEKCNSRAILTGTPIARNIEDLFGEYKFLDPNIIGTRYITSFRSNYCEQRNNGFGMVTVGAKNLDKLYAKIDPVTFRATKDELDLPPKTYDKRQFEMAPEQKKAYDELKKTFMLQLQDEEQINVTNAASAFIKLQCITSGFIKREDGSYIDLPNPRLEALNEVLEEVDGPVIIWARFNRDIQNIMKSLGKEAVAYYGATSSDEREEAKEGFLSGKYRFFVSNPAAGGTGLNLQGKCTTAIYYTNSFDAIQRWQSEDRIHRIGTKGTCTYIDLICRGSIDNRILANLRDKKSLSDLAIDEIRRMMVE